MNNSKLTFLSLSLVFVLINGASAKVLSKAEENSWQNKIAAACEKNYQAKKGDKRAVCECIGRSFIQVARHWSEPSENVAILEYMVDSYSNKLSQKELDQDRFYLDDIDFAIADGCLEDPSFKLKK
jgi:hypothetical protein